MSKHISSSFFYQLPSQNKVHPCRLIVKDGTLMWKHALLVENECIHMPQTEAHENHILKTAQRLEELNSWVSQGLDPWDSFRVQAWYLPTEPELSEGISVYFTHSIHDNQYTYDALLPHIQDHETLQLRQTYLYFQRC
tara:strand:+ start:13064 stop:13477 length:414 start_codon:yes stop_codon:yes gene_type:complete